MKAIGFDVDGTMTKTHSFKIFRKFLGMDPGLYKTHVIDRGMKVHDYREKVEIPEMRKRALEMGVTRSVIEELFEEKVELMDGVTEFIKGLKKDYEVFIISTAIDVYVETVLKRVGVSLDKVFCSQSSYCSKRVFEKYSFPFEDKGEVIRDLRKETGWKKNDLGFVGDSENDKEALMEAGFPVCVGNADLGISLTRVKNFEGLSVNQEGFDWLNQ